MSKKEKSSEILDVAEDASTRTIKANFRRKAKLLQTGKTAGSPVSKKTFQELNEAYQYLIQNRQNYQSIETKKVAVLSSDVAEYSRMMATHEKETLEFFGLCKEVFEELVEHWQGRIFNTAGDAILAEFDNVFNAVHCAVEIQKELRALNLGQPDDQKILFRMGLNLGEVFVQEGDLLGDAVNIAARIQTSAKPGGICASGSVFDIIANKTTYSILPLGEQKYKNIPEPIRTFAITEGDGRFKLPPPDPRIEPASIPKLPPLPNAKKLSQLNDEANSTKRIVLISLSVAAIIAAGVWALNYNSLAFVKSAPTVPSVSIKDGHVYFNTNPPAQLSFIFHDREVFSGPTPLTRDFAPGTYKVRMENKSQKIDEVMDLVVEENKLVKIEKEIGLRNFAPSEPSPAGPSPTPSALDPELMKGEREGDPEAEYRLAKHFAETSDFENAYLLFRSAAQKGQVEAEFELGSIFYAGQGSVHQDYDAAVYWLLKSALDKNKKASDFLTRNKFPPDYTDAITTQRRIDAKDFKGAGTQYQIQKLRLDDLKQKLMDKSLPY